MASGHGAGITVKFCPGNVTKVHDGGYLDPLPRVNWELPIFNGVAGDPWPRIFSTANSGQLFHHGATLVVYTALDKFGNKASCKFYVHVVRTQCARPAKPLNGVTVCDKEMVKTRNATFCVTMCKDGYDVPLNMPSIITCNNVRWSPYPAGQPMLQDCSVPSTSSSKMLPPSLYFSGDPANPEVTEKLKQNFIEFIKSSSPFCILVQSKCTTKNVQVLV